MHLLFSSRENFLVSASSVLRQRKSRKNLSASIVRHMENTQFTLSFSDKGRVDMMPGKPDIRFSPTRYIKHTTVERIRDIRLYTTPVDDYEDEIIKDAGWESLYVAHYALI